MPTIALLNNEYFDAENLENKHRGLPFFCHHSFCHDELIVVIGPKVINHFRHKHKPEHNHEPESREHLELKNFIKKSSDTLGLICMKEKAIIEEEKTHIPDAIIYLSDNDKIKYGLKGIAVECQCAIINSEVYNDRNQFYLSNGYIPLWIFGGNYLKRKIDESGYIRLKDIEKNNQEDYYSINQFSQGNLYESRFKFKNYREWSTIGNFFQNIIDLNYAIFNILESKYKDKNEIFKTDKKCGFFYQKEGKWISINLLVKKLFKNEISDDIKILYEEINIIKNKLSEIKNKIKEFERKKTDLLLEINRSFSVKTPNNINSLRVKSKSNTELLKNKIIKNKIHIFSIKSEIKKTRDRINKINKKIENIKNPEIIKIKTIIDIKRNKNPKIEELIIIQDQLTNENKLEKCFCGEYFKDKKIYWPTYLDRHIIICEKCKNNILYEKDYDLSKWIIKISNYL